MTDNECARSVIKKMGSKSTDLQNEASVLFQWCNSRRLLLDAHRILSHLNVCADALSRKDPRPAEWGLPQETFQKITDWHGPLQVDLMASPHNNKLPLYVSTFEYPGAVATDVLAVDWNQWQGVYIFLPSTKLHTAVATQTAGLQTSRGHSIATQTISRMVPSPPQESAETAPSPNSPPPEESRRLGLIRRVLYFVWT
ncbi:hypothetical protein HAZT_HAZT006558 [Hyalella azteca]|uniref:Uncharacterized protein n=1 Tax=Hyalella azteca TaxID=294128 RepID=A0A6A0GTW2_HYAAZ|nr:hypothetical protein HAZT_HAZT006558 [Hyalella azteca]